MKIEKLRLEQTINRTYVGSWKWNSPEAGRETVKKLNEVIDRLNALSPDPDPPKPLEVEVWTSNDDCTCLATSSPWPEGCVRNGRACRKITLIEKP